jgi:hypothetical protein
VTIGRRQRPALSHDDGKDAARSVLASMSRASMRSLGVGIVAVLHGLCICNTQAKPHGFPA